MSSPSASESARNVLPWPDIAAAFLLGMLYISIPVGGVSWISNGKLSFNTKPDRKERRRGRSLVKFHILQPLLYRIYILKPNCMYGQNESPVSSAVQLLALFAF